MSPGQTGHITEQMGRVPGTDGTHTRGCPAKILYVYWFFSSPHTKPLTNSAAKKKGSLGRDRSGTSAHSFVLCLLCSDQLDTKEYLNQRGT